MLVEAALSLTLAASDQKQTSAELWLVRVVAGALHRSDQGRPAGEADGLRDCVLGVGQLRSAVSSEKQAKSPRVTFLRLAQQTLRLAPELIEVGVPTLHGTIFFHEP